MSTATHRFFCGKSAPTGTTDSSGCDWGFSVCWRQMAGKAGAMLNGAHFDF